MQIWWKTMGKRLRSMEKARFLSRSRLDFDWTRPSRGLFMVLGGRRVLKLNGRGVQDPLRVDQSDDEDESEAGEHIYMQKPCKTVVIAWHR